MIYLDHNSTTPVIHEVADAMNKALTLLFGNPSSAHKVGSQARAAIDEARTMVARLAGCEPEAVTFCSSATEAINTVIGAAKGRVIATAVEHSATLGALKSRSSFPSILLPVSQDGLLDLERLEAELKLEPTALVTVLWVNNETGVISPIKDICELCQRYGVPLHVDAAQAVGKLQVDLDALPIDFLTFSAHKIGGPKGVAALVSQWDRPAALIRGGGQESGLRAGTENVPGIVGFGIAADLARENLVATGTYVGELRERLEAQILSLVPGTQINGAAALRVPNTSSISFERVGGDELAAYLDALDICVSTGSACHAATNEPSHVIQAMTGSWTQAAGTVRFSLGRTNRLEEIVACVAAVVAGVQVLRAGNPITELPDKSG
ncbi:MAG: cysteine desulfurase family protein [Pseudomonadota bacterium]